MEDENILTSPYPRARIPEKISLPELLLQHFSEYGTKIALISPKTDQAFTFADLCNLSRRTAIGLHRNPHVQHGDVVSICATNRAELFPIMMGVQLLGAIVNTVSPASTVRELVHQFGVCKTRFVVTTSDRDEKLQCAKARCESIRALIILDRRVEGCLHLPDLMPATDIDCFQFPYIEPAKDLAFLLNSSGTTGLPKAVMLTHRSVVANLCQVSQLYLEHPAIDLYTPSLEDTVISVFPLFHIGGISRSLWCLMNGTTMLVFERFDPGVFLDAIRVYKVTTLIAPPPVLIHYTKSQKAIKEDFASIRYVLSGTAPITEVLAEAIVDMMQPDYVIQTYGMTEMSGFCHVVPWKPLSRRKSGSCGVLVPNTQCKVIDIDTGRSVGPNDRGEICLRGAQVMSGYLNNEKATRKTIDEQGWLHTGDIGYYDEDEYMFIVDRIKDLIKVKGFQVAPAELEGILLTHPAIAEAAVVGVPDSYAGEVPRAYVVLKRGVQTVRAEEIKEFVASQVISYKR